MKKYIIILLIVVALVGGFLIFNSNRPHASFSRNWDTISQDFEIIDKYAMTKFPDEKNYIEFSELNDSDDENINNSLSAVNDYLNKHFDNGSYIQIVNKGNAFEYTCMGRHQYILVHIIDNEKETLKYYKKLELFGRKYIIDKLGDGWYLVFIHFI
ncbi:MAG: hypothetical protein NC177_07285 [Ruminococcus flavefaciens]|nr:hypothetical protein [Ruminococcus flavefaciens]